MDLKDFKESLDRNTPPEDLGRALQALWYQAKGEWVHKSYLRLLIMPQTRLSYAIPDDPLVSITRVCDKRD